MSLLRTAASIFAAVLTLPIASPLAVDPSLPRHDRAGGISLARRKDPAPSSGEPEIIPTLGSVYNTHTGEVVPLSASEPSPDRFSDLLADKALLGRADIAPELIGVLRALVRERPGARVEIVSGYRSPKRNEMMRKKGRHVASHSQHTMGHAVDFRVEGMSVAEMVKAVETLKWKGGLGRYDAKHDRFIHVDVGPDRRWRGK